MGRAAALALLLGLTPACIASSVLASSQRAVEPAVGELAWRPATAEDLRGLFESISIEGEAGGALWKVYYHFASDGSYTGAALVIGGAQPEFQTLSGKWSFADGLLKLGDDEALRAFAAPEHLKLESATGVAVLRRVALQ